MASLSIQTTPSKDSDQNARVRRLICVFAGRTCTKVRFLILRFICCCMSIFVSSFSNQHGKNTLYMRHLSQKERPNIDMLLMSCLPSEELIIRTCLDKMGVIAKLSPLLKLRNGILVWDAAFRLREAFYYCRMHLMRNTWKWPLCIRTGWSRPSLSAYRINGYCSICRRTENVQIKTARMHSSSEPSLFAYGIRGHFTLRKHTYIILTPLNPTFIE